MGIASSFLKKLRVRPTPVVPPEVLDKVSRKYQYKTKIIDKDKVVPMSQHEVARQARLDKVLNKKPSAMAMAKPDKKALAAARKANQPAGRTQKDRLREYMEAGGVNVPAGGFPDDDALRMAMETLKTPKATPIPPSSFSEAVDSSMDRLMNVLRKGKKPPKK